MSLSLNVGLTFVGVETLDGNVAYATAKAVTHDVGKAQATKNGASDVPVTDMAAFDLTLSSGAGSVNLAALPGAGGGTRDLTGKKLQYLFLENKSTNANSMAFTVGASNGYDVAGADFHLTLLPGQWAFLALNELAPDVASGDRTIDVAGTGSQVAKIGVVGG